MCDKSHHPEKQKPAEVSAGVVVILIEEVTRLLVWVILAAGAVLPLHVKVDEASRTAVVIVDLGQCRRCRWLATLLGFIVRQWRQVWAAEHPRLVHVLVFPVELTHIAFDDPRFTACNVVVFVVVAHTDVITFAA